MSNSLSHKKRNPTVGLNVVKNNNEVVDNTQSTFRFSKSEADQLIAFLEMLINTKCLTFIANQIQVMQVSQDRENDRSVTQMPGLVDKKYAAKYLGISTSKLDSLRVDGYIIGKLIGGKVLFEPQELKRFIASLPTS